MYNINKFMMDINIETLTGNSFQLKVSPNDSIESVKIKIQRLESIPVSHQDLIWQSTELEDNYTLKDYNIPDGATIKMVLKLRGGPINSRRMTTEDLFLRDVSELIEYRDDLNLYDSYAMNKHVTFLIFKDGDHYNLLRVIDKADSPLSGAMSATSMYPSDDREVDEEKHAENELTKEKLELLKSQLKKLNNKNINDNNTNNNVNQTNLELVNQELKMQSVEQLQQQQQQQNKPNVDSNNNSNKLIVHNPIPPSLPQTSSTTSATIQNLRLKQFNSLNLIQKTASDNVESNNADLIAISSSNLLTTDTVNEPVSEDITATKALIAAEINKNLKKSLIKYSHFDSNHQQQQSQINNDDDEIDDEDDVDDTDDYEQDMNIEDIAQELINKSIFISNLDANNNSNNNLINKKNRKLILASSSATSSAANNYYLQNLNVNDDTPSGNHNISSHKMNKKGSLKYVSSADSLLSRNNTSSKMLQSAISIQNNSSLDDLTSSSALMNNQKQYTNDNLKATTNTTDVNLTPAPIPIAQLENNDENNNNIKDDEAKITHNEAIDSFLQKRLNYIMSRATLSDDKEYYQTAISPAYLVQKQQQQQQQQQQQEIKPVKTTYRRFPQKFDLLYANKATSNLNKLNSEMNSNDEIQEQRDSEQQPQQQNNEETTYSLLQNPNTSFKTKPQINLSLPIHHQYSSINENNGPKIPPSLHHPLYQYPTSTHPSTSTAAHLQLNPLLFARNNSNNNNSNNLTATGLAGGNSNTISASNNRFELLMKNSNQKQSILNSKEDRILASPAERLLYSARSKKLPQSKDGNLTTTTTTTKLPPVKTKSDPSRYCYACHRKTGIATSYTCRCGNNFCSIHRNAEAHNCTYDYKTEGRKILEHSNPLVAAPKLPKI